MSNTECGEIRKLLAYDIGNPVLKTAGLRRRYNCLHFQCFTPSMSINNKARVAGYPELQFVTEIFLESIKKLIQQKNMILGAMTFDFYCPHQ